MAVRKGLSDDSKDFEESWSFSYQAPEQRRCLTGVSYQMFGHVTLTGFHSVCDGPIKETKTAVHTEDNCPEETYYGHRWAGD